MRILLCAGSLCRFYYADPSNKLHYAESIVQIRPCGFHRADFSVRVPSCPFDRFHRAHSIKRIPSRAFHQRHLVQLACSSPRPLENIYTRIRLSNSIVQMRTISCGSYRAGSIVRIPSSGFHHESSIICIPSCAFHRVHFIVCIASCDRRRKEGVNEDGAGYCTWAQCIHNCICIAVGINGDASTQNVLGESPSIDLDYSQRSLLSGELEAG